MTTHQFAESLESRYLLAAALLADINGIYPTNAVQLDGVSYFAASDNTHGRELWRSDRTREGTTLVVDLVAGKAASRPSQLRVVNDHLVFQARNADGTTRALYSTDGTAGGTTKIIDIGTDVLDLADEPQDGLLAFTTYHTIDEFKDYNIQIWVTDGTAAGTHTIKSIDHVRYNPTGQNDHLGTRTLLNMAGQIWGTDGTEAGTFQLTDLEDTSKIPNVFNQVRLGDSLITIGERSNVEVWSTDGSPQGTVNLLRLENAGTNAAMVAAGDKVYFEVSVPITGTHDYQNQLYVTDGTVNGTHFVADVSGGPVNVMPDGRLLIMGFPGAHDEHPIQLFTSDGTAEGTVKLADLTPGSTGGVAPVELDGHFYLIVSDQTAHADLWVTDGTSAGTKLITNLWDDGVTSSSSDVLKRPIVVDGKLVVVTPKRTLVFDPDQLLGPTGPKQGRVQLDAEGVLRVFGTRSDDVIKIYKSPGDNGNARFVVSLNGMKRSFSTDAVRKLIVYGYSGDDNIAFCDKYGGPVPIRSLIWSGEGNDTVFGSASRDTIHGEGGNDALNCGASNDNASGGDGNDTIAGAAGDDSINGDAGGDRISGGIGHDLINGGNDQKHDVINGDVNEDVIFGSFVYDIFYGSNEQELTGAVLEF